MSINTLFKSAVAAAALFASGFALAGVDTGTDKNGVILAGHDAVAYFTVGKPVVGNAEITAVYNDAIYRFSSEQHRDMFVANPEKYAPAYGGFCAFGTTFGKKFDVNGKAFEIVDGVLYVNKNEDVYNAWIKDVPKHLNEADKAWPEIENVSAESL